MKLCAACGARFNSVGWSCPTCYYQPKLIEGHLAFAPELAEVNDGFEAIFFSQLAKLEAKNFWFRSRNRLIIWVLRQYLPQIHNFFEIGCGTGFVLAAVEQAFPSMSLYGSEIFSQGLNFAQQRLSRTQLFQMDARKIPFVNEFDAIAAFDVLEHIKEDDVVLGQMHQALRKDGGIILTVPQHPFLWSYADDYARHVRRYRVRELKHKVERAGFQVIKMTSFVSLLLPLMIISRWQQQRPDPEYDGMLELKISGWKNAVLENILSLERTIIRLGYSFPAGGSLLCVARRS